MSNFNFVCSESSVGSRKTRKHLYSACKISRAHAIDCITQQYSFKASLSLDTETKHSGLKVTIYNLVKLVYFYILKVINYFTLLEF